MFYIPWMNTFLLDQKVLGTENQINTKKIPVALRPNHRFPISKSFSSYQSNKTET